MTRKLFYLLLIPVIILGVLLWSPQKMVNASQVDGKTKVCLLYTSDAADELTRV